ncbi:MAG: tetratricopeptide repeat protein [Cyanobacteria bacterium SZAS-4]|nr:tetratricopeptide repeat protein [Cyanobacteria bacterium SZAS-4]
MHETGIAKRHKPQHSFVMAGIISLSLVFNFVILSNFQVSCQRIKMLHDLASCKDKRKIYLALGNLYVEAEEYSRAIDCYRLAIPKQWSKEKLDSFWVWGRLDQEDSFDPHMHVGFGEVFESLGQTKQAVMEYKQSLALAPYNKKAEERLGSLEVKSRNEKVLLQPIYQKLEADLAAKWNPPPHSGCLVTRCYVFTDENGLDVIELVGKSGSNEHDRSALAVLKSLPYKDFAIFRLTGIYDFGCMSEGQEKTITFMSLGAFNKVETTENEQIIAYIERLVQSFKKQTGALRL